MKSQPKRETKFKDKKLTNILSMYLCRIIYTYSVLFLNLLAAVER